MKITEKDRLILRELQKDSSQPLKELSKKTGIAVSTLHSRIGQLKKEGVIKKFSVVVDPAKLGKGATAMVFLKMRQSVGHDANTHLVIADKLRKLPEINDIFIIAGEFDICLKVKGTSIDDIANLVMSRLRGIGEVTDSQTFVVFTNAKESLDVDI